MGIFAKLKQLMNLDASIKVKSQESLALDSKIKELSYNLELLKQRVQEEHIALENAVNNRESELAETRKQQEQIIDSYKTQLEEAKKPYDDFMEQFNKLKDNCDKAEKRKTSLNTILKVYRKLIKTINSELLWGKQIQPYTYKELERLTPEVELHLHSHDIKQLRSELSENDKIINNILERYEKRYTTKTNRALYQLMVIALQAEMQNILIHLRYNRLQDCKDRLTGMIDKYSAIVKDGNQTIAPTINSFIQEMGTLFEAKIDIEFEYYAKKEQEKQEQLALKEQMRQEAEERRALEIEEKKVQKEEEKYKSEIANIEKQVAECNDSAKLSQLQSRIGELMEQLSKLEEKKEEIIKRQNGKAGYVYVISNLGSFGDSTFKVGMTRRLDPMDRVKELGDASVPFAFDVHSFIFSDDAVGLEAELHKRLYTKRKNKINSRKEFFDVSVDELEALVQEINPTAEFNKTMIAMEYRQGLERQSL